MKVPTMKTTSRFAVAITIGAGAFAGMAMASSPSVIQKENAARQFRLDNPEARIMNRFDRPHKIAATRIAGGATALESANNALESVATMLGVDASAFNPVGPFPNGAHTIQLGYQPDSGEYKFTSVYWTQTADGLPVYNTRLNILVRNVQDHPAVYVTSDLRDVGGFKAFGDLRPNRNMAQAAAARQLGVGSTISNPEIVCFAGVEDMRISPRTAMVFDAQNGSKLDGTFKKFLLIVDLETGVVLHEKNLIVHAADGSVSGLATEDSGADECHDEVPTPMPYLQVSGGGNTTYTDVNGNFSLPSSGTVNVTAGVSGQFYTVNNTVGGETSGSTTIPNGGFGSITLNEANNDEATRAQINAYVEANRFRDYLIDLVPSYPVMSTESFFPINVMVSGSCNAYYDYSSINFFPASGGCNNTAFSVVVHHEIGHHVVASGGSGQGSYGEGLGDICGIAITGDPQLARGFFQGDCGTGIRNADNDFQYPCTGGSSVHYCGQLLSACFWDMLGTMSAYPNGNDIVSRLFFESVTVHSGESIDPTITLDILVLDDDDGNLDNGTPHSAEILQAMELHSMDEIPEPLGNDFCASAYPVTHGATAFSTVGAFSDSDPFSDTQCSGTYLGTMDADVWFSYEACESGPMTVSTCDTVSFDSSIVVYEGDCDNKTQVACNGDGPGCGGYTSSLSLTVNQGSRYLIRVGGYDSGSIGNGNIIIEGPSDGPPCNNAVVITIPELPELIDPSGGTTMSVSIEPGDSQPDEGTAMLMYRNNGGAWISSDLVAAGGDVYTATFPAMECGSADFYISVEADGAEVTLPGGAPADVYSKPVYTDLEVAFDDNFQTDQGWSVINGATTGNWERTTPSNGGVRCDNPNDADGSGICYLTGNGVDEDIDGGSTTLISPVISCTSGSTVSYWRWFANNCGADANNDTMDIDISYDGGSTWNVLEVVGPVNEANGGWYNPSFILGDVPNETIVLRFIANDTGAGSVVEAAVDGIRVERPICNETPECPGDFDGNGVIDVNDLLFVISAYGTPEGDANGDGGTDVDDILFLINLYGSVC
ncbi:MAG: hypothetical protein CMJ40_04470 [Phycisphaerae bacterium]|nr:hypothetical protein [Phycisphaerae bacterium]